MCAYSVPSGGSFSLSLESTEKEICIKSFPPD
jgi:hypothetical protein